MLLGFVTIVSLIILGACGAQEKTMSFQRIDQSLQYDLRLTYYYKGDTVTKQTTDSFWSYKTLGATKKEDVKDRMLLKCIKILRELKKSIKASKELLTSKGFKEITDGKFEKLK